MIADAHCHFFSANFFRTLGAAATQAASGGDAAETLPKRLGWDPPGEDGALADRWVQELDRHRVGHAMLIASVPGDEASAAAAVERHPDRLVGAFMFNPGGARRRVTAGTGVWRSRLCARSVCFPRCTACR